MEIVTINKNNKPGLLSTAQSIAEAKVFGMIKAAYLIDGGSDDLTQNDWNYLNQVYDIAISEKDNGIYDAMNKGLKFCNGSHVMMLNSGDVLCIECFDTISSLDINEKYIYYGNWYKDGRVETPRNLSLMKWGYFPLNHQAMIIPTEQTYDASLKICGDLDIICRMNNLGYIFEYIDVPIIAYEGGGVSSKRSITKLIEKNKVIIKNYSVSRFLESIVFQCYILIKNSFNYLLIRVSKKNDLGY